MTNQEIEIQKPNTFIFLLMSGLKPSHFLPNILFSFRVTVPFSCNYYVLFGQPIGRPNSWTTVDDSMMYFWCQPDECKPVLEMIQAINLYIFIFISLSSVHLSSRQNEQFLFTNEILDTFTQLLVIFLPCGESCSRRRKLLCREKHRWKIERWRARAFKCVCHCS